MKKKLGVILNTIHLLSVKGSSVDEVIDQLTEFYKSNKTKLMGNMLYYSPFIIMLSIVNMKRLKIILRSQFYSNINSAESSLQVQYNRALVQLGLSAFRAGSIEESHKILNEIVNSQRSKELLGQGFNSKFPNQATVLERQNYYHSINILIWNYWNVYL